MMADKSHCGVDALFARLGGMPPHEIASALRPWLEGASRDDVSGLVESASEQVSESNRAILTTIAEYPSLPEFLRLSASQLLLRQLDPSERAWRARQALADAREGVEQVSAILELLASRDCSVAGPVRGLRPKSRLAAGVRDSAVLALEQGVEEVMAEFRRRPRPDSPHLYVIAAFLPDLAVQGFLVSDLLLSADDRMVAQAIILLDALPVAPSALGDRGAATLLSVVGGERRLKAKRLYRLNPNAYRVAAASELGDALPREDWGVEVGLLRVAAGLDPRDADQQGILDAIERTLSRSRSRQGTVAQ